MQFYASVRETYNGVSEYRTEINRLREEKTELKMARELDRDQFLEFRQHVATLMPEMLKEKGQGEEGYPFRSLASLITRSESIQLRQVIAKTLFERGKESFHKKDYAKAKRAFEQIIERYSYTPYVTESYFLLSETHFQKQEFEESIRVIQHMVDLFPHAELTGFALVRLGRIYEMQNRNEEAVDIYKTVLRTFPQRDVASQARSSLKGVEL